MKRRAIIRRKNMDNEKKTKDFGVNEVVKTASGITIRGALNMLMQVLNKEEGNLRKSITLRP